MASCPNTLAFRIQEIYSHVTRDTFVVCYPSIPSRPRTYTLHDANDMPKRFELTSQPDEVLLVLQLYCSRDNDDGIRVAQFLGSAIVDISQVTTRAYRFRFHDTSNQPALYMGQVALTFTHVPTLGFVSSEGRVVPHHIQSSECTRRLFDAAEANLTWIEGFGKRGLPPIVHGLKRVHSPYYINHLGVAMPSGSFCMIPTWSDDTTRAAAVRSYEQRLAVALARNTCTHKFFVETVADMMTQNIRAKHIRCLNVIADCLTLHTRIDMHYTPDVRLMPEPTSTERWSIPREPKPDGGTVFSGDCEDYAREVYQHCKEIKEWVVPKCNGTPIEAMSAVLHLYVPTIEQGAVDHNAHSKYITYEAEYRNHIWAALHPRDAFLNKCSPPCTLNTLYKAWPKQHVENTLPLLHLEGTGDVYPVVTLRKPGFVAKLQMKQDDVQRRYPWLMDAETPDMSLQCRQESNFYKYAIACMTDAFSAQGLLDFTYITSGRYGVPIFPWARGQYHMRPSTKHSNDIMQDIRHMLTIERPISPILTKSKIVQSSHLTGYALRYGQHTPFVDVPPDAKLGIYRIGDQSWYELYFYVTPEDASSSNDVDGLMLI